jgi:hypothetical protein
VKCKHCQNEIEPSKSVIPSAPWRHINGQMITCFGENGMPLKTADGGWYLIATPEESN